jgi:phosphoribosylaminoimidazole-succinocarboxamide synthase
MTDAKTTVSPTCTFDDQNVALVDLKTKQKQLVDDAQLRTSSLQYMQAIENSYDKGLQITSRSIGNLIVADVTVTPIQGKVRDRYVGAKTLALVTTDRQSGFDRMLALVPFKGAVLNLTSAYWFSITQDIIPNHLLEVPHPNVSIVKKCKPFPIEFVVRYVKCQVNI